MSKILKSQNDTFLDKNPYTYMYIHTLIIIIKIIILVAYTLIILSRLIMDEVLILEADVGLYTLFTPSCQYTHTFLYGSQISNYFGLNPPTQFRDIPTVGWRLLTCHWFRELIPRWYGMATFSNMHLQTGSYRIGRNCSQC